MRGFWDDVQNFISEFGISYQSGLAVAKALASPTLQNIRAVEAAFAAEGASPPPELMETLWQRYYQAVADNPYYASGSVTNFLSSPLVWIGGGLLLLFALKKR